MQHTKEGNARRVGKMESLTVFAEVFGAVHYSAYRFKHGRCSSADLSPRSVKSMDWSGAESGYDGSQS